LTTISQSIYEIKEFQLQNECGKVSVFFLSCLRDKHQDTSTNFATNETPTRKKDLKICNFKKTLSLVTNNFIQTNYLTIFSDKYKNLKQGVCLNNPTF